MGLREQLMADLKEAMRAGDPVRKSTLRMLLAAITNAEKAPGAGELTDDDILAIIRRQVKQRRDSIEQYRKGSRQDLVAEEEAELNVLLEYLPPQLTEDEIEAAAREVIQRVGATGMAQMGEVMRSLMAEIGDRADGRVVSQIVRRLLTEG